MGSKSPPLGWFPGELLFNQDDQPHVTKDGVGVGVVNEAMGFVTTKAKTEENDFIK